MAWPPWLLKIDLDNQFSAEARRLFKSCITFGAYTSYDYSSCHYPQKCNFPRVEFDLPWKKTGKQHRTDQSVIGGLGENAKKICVETRRKRDYSRERCLLVRRRLSS